MKDVTKSFESILIWEEPSRFLNRFATLVSPLVLLNLEILESFINDESTRLGRELIRSLFKRFSQGLDIGLESIREVYDGSGGLKLDLRQQRTIGSSKRLWGLCFHVGQRLTSRLTVAAGVVYDRGRLIGPPGKYERWSSGASTGPVGNDYYNRPDELILACRI
ncbi:hypothetical protein PIB30_027946 [Stylosanthes scabra]|uniref:Uncharacterized protein n=1 Tax=Stylosanthes scabra TaxID=79078 RepID=A0ABU6SAV6_9FABA|nr:hypothetical protein [Stylosanthes scabra]